LHSNFGCDRETKLAQGVANAFAQKTLLLDFTSMSALGIAIECIP
jgi:hypothetical protein